MKITTTAPRFQWAKRSLSIVVCTAMLLTGLVFATSVPAAAYLQVADMGIPSPPGGYTFVVPETIYLKPAVSGTNTPQYFLNNDINGKAVQNETEANMSTGKLYIGHENAFAYKLYYGGDRTTPKMKYTCIGKGELWMPTVSASTTWLAEPTYLGENTSAAREWFVEMHMDTDGDDMPDEWQNLVNVGAVYQPMHYNSLVTAAVKRGGIINSWFNNNPGGIDMDFLFTVNGLHKNWVGANQHDANGRVHPPFTTWTRWYPLLNDLQGDTSGAQDFAKSGDAGHPLLARRAYFGNTGDASGTPPSGQINHNGYSSTLANHVLKPLSDTTNNMSLRIDTSRNTTFRGIPNFKFGYMQTWTHGSNNTRPIKNDSNTRFRAWSGDNGTAVPFRWSNNTTGFTDVSGNGISDVFGQGSIFYTNETAMNNLSATAAASRGFQIFSLRAEWHSARTNSDWFIADVPFRVNIDSSSKAEMRKRYQNTIWQGPTRAGAQHTSAMTNIGYRLADPLRGEDQASMNGWSQIARPDVSTPSVSTTTYGVVQDYVFHDIGGNVTVRGNGTISPFTAVSTAPKKYAVSTGNYNTTNAFSGLRASSKIKIDAPYKESVIGYVNTHTTFNGTTPTFPIIGYLTGNATVAHHYTPISYTIKYDGNGAASGTTANSTFYFNATQSLRANGFSKPGYTFDGWSKTKNGGKDFAGAVSTTPNLLSANPNADGSTVVTLYARWIPASSTVNFVANGGTATETSRAVKYDEKYIDTGALPTATRTGYDFDGWWTKNNFTVNPDPDRVRVTANSVVKNLGGNYYLYAKWNPQTIDITLDAQGGVWQPGQDFRLYDVAFASIYPTMPTPTRAGYEFKGWSTIPSDPALTKEIVSGTSQVGGASGTELEIMAGNHMLYAQWEAKEYTVTFDPDGGVITANPSDSTWTSGTATMKVTFGQPYPVLATAGTMPAGATGFDGWYVVESGDTTTVLAGATNVTQTANHTLKAKWIIASTGVTFQKNGGVFTADTLSTKDVTAGQLYGFLPTPTRPGYIFAGWWDNAAFGGTEVKADTTVTNGSAHSLWAKWTAEDYTVTFMPEGGELAASNPSGVTLAKTVKYDTAYDTNTEYAGLPVVEREGYTFDGWYLSAAPVSGETEIVGTTILGGIGNGTPVGHHKLYARWTANPVTVTFDANGGSAPAAPYNAATAVFGGTYGSLDFGGGTFGPLPAIPTLPARNGYTFDGWWTDADAGTKVRDTTTVTDSAGHTLYAHWIAQPVEVMFIDTLGGNVFDPATKEVSLVKPYGVLPGNLSRIGYDFAGWWPTNDCLTAACADCVSNTHEAITETTLVPSDANVSGYSIYAQWTPKTIEVTLDYDDGTTPLVRNVTYDETYAIFPELDTVPTRTGFTFDVWSLAGFDVSAGSASVVQNPVDHTITALWIGDDHTVTYDAGTDGTVTPADKTVTNGLTYGEGSALATPARPGYDFKGWFTQPDGAGDEIKNDTKVFLTDDTQILYAKWAKKTLKVSFDTNGGDAITATQDVTFDELYPYAALPTPVRAGYAFDAWLTAGGVLVEENVTMVEIPTDHKLVAQWIANEITVDFDAQGGAFLAAGEETREVLFGDIYGNLSDGTDAPLPVPVLGGSALKGWYTEPLGAGRRIKASSDVTNADDPQTLYAHWIPSDLNITLYENYDPTDPAYIADNEKTRVVGVVFNTAYDDALSHLTRKGYTFKGWFDARTGGTLVEPTDIASDASLTKLYAQWAIKTPTVSFNLGYVADPADEIDPQTITYGEAYSTAAPDGFPAPPARAGYAFDGWWTTPDEIGSVQVKADTIMNKEADHWLYAHWKPAAYDLTFDENGGDPLGLTDPKSVTVGKTYGNLPTPTYTGYDFDGWYTPADVKVTASSIVTEPAAHTLKAKWTIATFTLTFNGNGGTPDPADKTVTYGQAYGPLATAEYAGYNFKGWSSEKDDFKNDGALDNEVTAATVAGLDNQTVFAQWEAKTDIVVTLEPTDGDAIDPADATFNATFNAPYPAGPGLTKIDLVPTRTGYVFAGWYTKETGGKLVDGTTDVTNSEPHTLYARWTAKDDIQVTLDSTTSGGSAVTTPTFNVTYDAAYGNNLKQTPAKAGHGFKGWYDAPTGGNKVEAATIVKTAANQTLHAQWIENGIEVVFNFNYTDAVPSSVTRSYAAGADYDNGKDSNGDPAPMPALTRPGYTGEWCTAQGVAGGTIVASTDDPVAVGATMLYARWTPDEYDLNFTDSAFSLTPTPATKKIYFGKAYGALATMPANPGYKFLGWYDTAAQTGGNEITAATVADDTDPVTAYARWEAITYRLTLNNNYTGAPASAIKPIVYGQPYGDVTEIVDGVWLPVTRAGYVFKGWSKDPNDFKDNGTLLNAVTDATVTGIGNQIVYAQWEAKSNIKVTLDSNGGAPVATEDFYVTFGEAYGNDVNQVPVLSGSEFQGWFPSAAGPDGKISNTSVVKEAEDHVLYARWESAEFGLYFDPGVTGGTDWEAMFVEDGKPYSYNPKDPSTPNAFPDATRAGYTLLGWYNAPTGGAKVAITDIVPDGTMVAQSKLYARWAPKSYTVTFDSNGGTPATSSKSVVFDTAYGALPAPTRKDHRFDGWFTSGGKKITAATLLDVTIMSAPDNHTLYARWTQINAPTPPTTPNPPTTKPPVKPSASYTLAVRNGSGSGQYAEGSQAQISASLPSGMVFVEWLVVGGIGKAAIADPKAAATRVTVHGNATIAVIYKPAAAAGTKFKVEMRDAPGTGEYVASTVVPLVASAPAKGMVFDKWVVSGGSATVADLNSPDTTATITGKAVITATYKPLDTQKYIFSTRFKSTFINWLLFFLGFGWIWMWFFRR